MSELKKIALSDGTSRRTLARRLADAVVSQLPGGPFLTAVYSVTHPDKRELLRGEWEAAVTGQLNEIIERLEPTIKLSDAAIDLAVGLSRLSAKGRAEILEFAAIQRQLPEMKADQVPAAMGELELDGLVKVQKFLGGRAIYTPTNKLFWLFDPLAFKGMDPRDDAKTLAAALVRDGVLQSSSLTQQLGWTARRFNPAMSLLLEVLSGAPDVIVSRTVDPDFVALEVRVDGTGMAALRREFRLTS